MASNKYIYIYLYKKRHEISPTVYHEKRCSKSSSGISDLATVVRNPWNKGYFLWNHSSLFAVGVRNLSRKGDIKLQLLYTVCK
jgi:hypothetical protein